MILPGERQGRLLILSKSTERRQTYLKCLCDCGAETTARAHAIAIGSTKSCGCLQREMLNRVNGKSRTPEYRAWFGMKDRCLNTSNRRYASYGGRGIKVCERWQNSFENFFVDMGERPSHDDTLDRIDNDGNYEPGNCRWASKVIQNNNKRNNVRIVYRGSQMTIGAAARLAGVVSPSLAAARFRVLGWSVEEAVETRVAIGAA